MKSRLLHILGLSFLFLSGLFVSCTEKEIADALEVSPSSVTFESKASEDAVLNVESSAEWDFTASSWITCRKDGNTLAVNCQDNTSSSKREGWIRFTAGAAEPVTVKVYQNGADGTGEEPEPGEGELAVLVSADLDTEIKIKDESSVTLSVMVSLSSPASEDVKVRIITDNGYLNAYNEADLYHYKKAVLLPSEVVTLPENPEVTIPTGRSESDVLDIEVKVSDFVYDERHLLPLHLESVENAVISDESRLNFIIVKPKPVKNIVVFETNETNPLNALEYKLEDGSNFFDIAVLFSSNIVERGRGPQLEQNNNVQMLLNEKDIYLQPLRDVGIKVYLGLLGHHTVAGLGNLSDKGAIQFADEVGLACSIYGLDGVFLDDEYTDYGTVNEWYVNPSREASSRLCYELKRAMKERCPWETEVSYWPVGYYNPTLFPVVVDGVEHPVSSFIDIVTPGYSRNPATVYGDLTKADCGYRAFELNKGGGPVPGELSTVVAEGYGYCMWFAFHPSDKGTVSNNRVKALEGFKNAANDLYGMTVVDPTHYYDKMGKDGPLDPTRHPL